MSKDVMMLDPIIVTPRDKPAPITIGGEPYYPKRSFRVFEAIPPHIVTRPVNLQLGNVGLVNLAEFSIKINDINGAIKRYNASLSKDEISLAILEAEEWLDKYALDFENSREIEIYIEVLEEASSILENAEKSLVFFEKEAEQKFDILLNNNMVRLSNFKKFQHSKPGLISAAYESNIAYFRNPRMTQEYIKLWKENVEIPQGNILIEKQKIEASWRSLSETIKNLNGSLEQIKQKAQENEIQTNAEYISTFFEHITEKYGDLANQKAVELADSVKGKKIRSVDEAIKALDKYKESINKFNKKDREAISKALDSLDMKSISDDLYIFNKAFKFGGRVFSVLALEDALKKGYKDGDWKPFYIELEKLVLDKAAAYVAGLALVTLASVPLGIVGYSILMVVVSALISDDLVEKIHHSLFE